MKNIIARHLVVAVSNALLDQFIRVSILAHAAGADVRRWTSNPGLGLREAARTIPELTGPDADAKWLSMRDTGLYSSIVGTARKVLDSRELAEEVAANMISGLTDSLVKDPKKRDDPHRVGQLQYIATKYKNLILAGQGFSYVKAALMKQAAQRAIDVVRTTGRQEAQRQKVGPKVVNITPGAVEEGVPHDVPSFATLSPGAQRDVLLDVLDESGPTGEMTMRWLLDLWRQKGRPADVQVIEAWLENPNRTNAEIGRALGHSSAGTFVGLAMKRLINLARQEIEHTIASGHGQGTAAPILRAIDKEMNLRNLGYEGARTASSRNPLINLLRSIKL